MRKIGSINDQNSVAVKLDVLKLSYMSGANPHYPMRLHKDSQSAAQARKYGISPASGYSAKADEDHDAKDHTKPEPGT